MKRLFSIVALVSSWLPAVHSQDYALKQLENSPRHHEWVKVKNGDRTVHAFVAFPEIHEKALSVIVIHENRGLTDWVRSFADQLAEAGYLAIAPDLLSGYSDEYDKTSDFPDSDAARQGIYNLDPDQVTGDLKAIKAFIAAHPSASGKVVVAGFCWGGSQSFRFATNDKDILGAMVFYGGPPSTQEDIDRITAPVYGFYGENDERINSTIEPTLEKMKKSGKTYDYVIYPGAGHAYMRRGDDPAADQSSKEARDKSFKRLVVILDSLKSSK